MSEMEKQDILELPSKTSAQLHNTDGMLGFNETDGGFQVTLENLTQYIAGDAKEFIPPTHGTAGQLLRSTGDGGSEWGDAASPEEIAEAVTDWLDENVPTGETLIVDESLTIEGAAADAKVTGEKITAAEDAITDLRKEMFSAPINYTGITTSGSWTTGSGVNVQTGGNVSDSDYCRTGFIKIRSTTYIHLDSETYEFNVWEYTSNNTSSAIFAPKGAYNDEDAFVTFDQNATYFRIGARRKDLAHIQASDITALTGAIKTYATTDPTLSIPGTAADAKVTGDVKGSVDRLCNAFGTTNLLETFNIDLGNRPYIDDDGITWTDAGDGKVHVSGTALRTSYRNYYQSNAKLPNGFIHGQRYYVNFNSTGDGVHFLVYKYNGSTTTTLTEALNANPLRSFVIPDDAQGLIIRLWIRNGTTVDETVSVNLFQASSELDVFKAIYSYDLFAKHSSVDDVTEFCKAFVTTSGSPSTADVEDWPLTSQITGLIIPGWFSSSPIDGERRSLIEQYAAPYDMNSSKDILRRTKTLAGWQPWTSLLKREALSDYVSGRAFSEESKSGITYTPTNISGKWLISGSSTAGCFYNVVDAATLSQGNTAFLPGDYLALSIKGSDIVKIEAYYNTRTADSYVKISEAAPNSVAMIKIPNNAYKLIVRLYTSSTKGVTINDTVEAHIYYGSLVNAIAQGGGTVYNTVEKETVNNTYNITTSPTITTDANGWLQAVDTNTEDETGKTDMTGAIMSMLTDTGYCHLGPGIFYVSGSIDMPTGAVLEGCGKNTIIRLLSSVTSGYCVSVTQYNTVKNVCFSGAYTLSSPSSANIGGRSGIYFVANSDGQESAHARVMPCVVDGCFFEGFNGSAIYQHNTGGGTHQTLTISNCFIDQCEVGINIDYYSEYCKYTNVITRRCYYACINNGGNNVFTGCTFHGTIGFYIDGSQRNSAHGSVIGCSFNHIDNWNHSDVLGMGDAVVIENCNNGFIFTGCQLWYGEIRIRNSKGIAFSDCLIGGNTPVIEVTGSYGAFFSDCIFHQQPDLTNVNSASVFDNCRLDSTAALVTP